MQTVEVEVPRSPCWMLNVDAHTHTHTNAHTYETQARVYIVPQTRARCNNNLFDSKFDFYIKTDLLAFAAEATLTIEASTLLVRSSKFRVQKKL